MKRATETLDAGLILHRLKPKTINQQTKGQCEPTPCVVDRWAGSCLTRRPKGPFAVSWPRQFDE